MTRKEIANDTLDMLLRLLAHLNYKHLVLGAWGCGTTGTGKNMLGIILMETRDILCSRLQGKP